MMDDIAYPRPAPLEERLKIRGCRNCISFDNQGRCRASPQPVNVDPSDWCGHWQWAVNPRVGWNSAFAGRELTDPQPAAPEPFDDF